jgi:hypothetical protein
VKFQHAYHDDSGSYSRSGKDVQEVLKKSLE